MTASFNENAADSAHNIASFGVAAVALCATRIPGEANPGPPGILVITTSV